MFDATLLPGKATQEGWLEPGTAIHYEDLLELDAVKTSVVDDFPELFYKHVQKPGGYGSEQFA